MSGESLFKLDDESGIFAIRSCLAMISSGMPMPYATNISIGTCVPVARSSFLLPVNAISLRNALCLNCEQINPDFEVIGIPSRNAASRSD